LQYSGTNIIHGRPNADHRDWSKCLSDFLFQELEKLADKKKPKQRGVADAESGNLDAVLAERNFSHTVEAARAPAVELADMFPEPGPSTDAPVRSSALSRADSLPPVGK
jgi:hypothetical protein